MSLSQKARDFLNEPRFASLATINEDGSVQQTVMWYKLEDDHVMMNTARGRVKDRNLLRDPRISICVEDGYRFVTIAGTATLHEDPEQGLDDILALAARYGSEAATQPRAETYFAKQHRITIHLPLTHVIENGFE